MTIPCNALRLEIGGMKIAIGVTYANADLQADMTIATEPEKSMKDARPITDPPQRISGAYHRIKSIQ